MSATTKPMMACGHQANGYRHEPDGTRTPVCVICTGLGLGGDVPAATPPDLTGRTARCTYYGSRPSGRLREGPCQRDDRNAECRCERPSTDAETGTLPFFEHRPDDEHDRYYCGCWGWD